MVAVYVGQLTTDKTVGSHRRKQPMTTATKHHTWHGLPIPDCLEPAFQTNSRGIRLRLVRESDRREWELISLRTLKRAKEQLGIRSEKRGSVWYWVPSSDMEQSKTESLIEAAES